MKKSIYIFFICLFAVSCSTHSDEEPEKTPEQLLWEIRLYAKEKSGNIFEPMVFSAETESNAGSSNLGNSFDSIVWAIPEIGHFCIFHHTSSYTHFVHTWSHHFFLPAQYECFLLGYKDDEVISADTVLLVIRDNSDFLGYNWKDIAGALPANKGYVDALNKEYYFVTRQAFDRDTPSVSLFVYKNRGYEEDFLPKSKEILFDYICSLYSEPAYGAEDAGLLLEHYDKLFRNKREQAIPLCIWITPKARIVLLAEENEFNKLDEYRIYAEPNI